MRRSKPSVSCLRGDAWEELSAFRQDDRQVSSRAQFSCRRVTAPKLRDLLGDVEVMLACRPLVPAWTTGNQGVLLPPKFAQFGHRGADGFFRHGNERGVVLIVLWQMVELCQSRLVLAAFREADRLVVIHGGCDRALARWSSISLPR